MLPGISLTNKLCRDSEVDTMDGNIRKFAKKYFSVNPIYMQ